MALVTLRAMALGGMRDHLGGGFHRYSVDGDWRVPHFEKMLYDQAQLVLAYVEAAQVTGDLFYRRRGARHAGVRAARPHRPGRRLLFGRGRRQRSARAGRRRRTPHKTEGAFYIWRDEEIGEVLGADADIFRHALRRPARRQRPVRPAERVHDKNLLYTARPLEEVARRRRHVGGRGAARRSSARALALFERRATRPRPHLDDKVLTAWNGLMIAASPARRGCCSVERAAARPGVGYLDDARRAAAFVRDAPVGRATGTLLRRYRQGDAGRRGLRRRLRVPDLRAARAVSGRRRSRRGSSGR